MIAILIFAAWVASGPDMFTIQADVLDSVTLPAECGSIREYLNNRDVFHRHFPGMIGIRRIDAARSEWTYEVTPPLASTRRTSYIVNERHSDANTVIFETDTGADDYLYCRAQVNAATDTTTTLTLELRLRSSREHGSDIHFLAPLLGQDFISARMRDQLKTDITTFFRRITDEFDAVHKNSH
jgi:hypothetical protein